MCLCQEGGDLHCPGPPVVAAVAAQQQLGPLLCDVHLPGHRNLGAALIAACFWCWRSKCKDALWQVEGEQHCPLWPMMLGLDVAALVRGSQEPQPGLGCEA